jgi:hypothetical protein
MYENTEQGSADELGVFPDFPDQEIEGYANQRCEDDEQRKSEVFTVPDVKRPYRYFQFIRLHTKEDV